MDAKSTMPIAEHELREALRSYLRSMTTNDGRLVEELCIENGSSRIDMAVIAEHIAGYEIKSDFDTSKRLHNQIHSYNRVFDHIYIVTGPGSAKEIHSLLPSWWGILRGERAEDGSIRLDEVRSPVPNPGRDPYSILTLLKRQELNGLAEGCQLPKKIINGNKPVLLETLADTISLEEITSFVKATLKDRFQLLTA